MRWTSLIAALLMLIARSPGGEVASSTLRPAETDDLVEALVRQGVPLSAIVGIHANGIPILCQAPDPRGPAAGRFAVPSRTSSLPAATRGWEVIPSVIRSDASDSCRLEVDVNGPVTKVTMDGLEYFSLDTPGPDLLEMRDDGQGLDRVAGDFIYTAGPFHYRIGVPFPSHYRGDAASPEGLKTSIMGRVVIEELDHSMTEFLLAPEVGVLRADIPNRPIASSQAPDLVTMQHLINVKTSTRDTQRFLRFMYSDGDIGRVTRRIYQLLPDVFDFLVFLSVDKIEHLPYTTNPNFNAGVHLQVQVNYSGTGLPQFANQGGYGSQNRLLGVSVLDAFDRGIQANNVTHEISHQWAAYMQTALTAGTAPHYTDCSVGSLLGGRLWTDNGDGTFTRDCSEGLQGLHHAPALDLYLMGLVDAAAVAPLHVAASPFSCSQPITSWTTVTMADIQALNGVRAPDPVGSQKHFRIGFVAESHDRLLTPTELTFFEILAEHYTKVLPPEDPDPYMAFNWPPVTRYFGHGSTWESTVPPLLLAAGSGGEPSGLTVSISPNPGPGSVTVSWAVSGTRPGDSIRLELFDLVGRRLRHWKTFGDTGSAWWDGRDDSGRYVGAGVYLCRLTAGKVSTSRRFTLLD